MHLFIFNASVNNDLMCNFYDLFILLCFYSKLNNLCRFDTLRLFATNILTCAKMTQHKIIKLSSQKQKKP